MSTADVSAIFSCSLSAAIAGVTPVRSSVVIVAAILVVIMVSLAAVSLAVVRVDNIAVRQASEVPLSVSDGDVKIRTSWLGPVDDIEVERLVQKITRLSQP